MKLQKILSYISLLCLSGVSVLFVGAQNPSTAQTSPAPEPGGRPHSLVWDAMEKTYYAEFEETVATYTFWVTNTSRAPVLITAVTPACSCTIADNPQPWKLAPGEVGELKASMNFAGQIGEKEKTMAIDSTGGRRQVLTLKVNIPHDDNEERRARNMAAAAKDRQAVLKGDCAACHVEPLKGLKGEDLFVAGCNICHDPPNNAKRAQVVPDLKTLAFPTDKAYWKKIIADGKEGTLMPGFATAHGGPLTDEEIESLAEYAVKAFPFDPANVKKTN
ncbi:MAG: DUF1573 domain-containing protein [Verrucomicrobia bacterium]|nr:DUF1573 domain-containing protein [Verrucomicrobiota bacterium]